MKSTYEMNPAGTFEWPAREAQSVILTSGTLSPLTSFQSELNQKFPFLLSAPHVIDQSQVLAFTIVNGIGGIKFNSSFQNLEQNSGQLIKSLGETILLLIQHIPAGVIMFLPNYNILQKIINHWIKSGIYQKIELKKKIFYEDKDSTDDIVKNYKKSISMKIESLLIGVVRGKISEGVDFIDDQCRSVIVFGVPYPAKNDIQISLKKEYNTLQNKNDSSKIDGREWYNMITYRSVSQAIGRCIRHSKDFGSIILLDERFSANSDRFPRWIKFQHLDSIENLIEPLNNFYQKCQHLSPPVLTKTKNVHLSCHQCNSVLLILENPQNDVSIDFPFDGFWNITELKQRQQIYQISKKLEISNKCNFGIC